MRRSGRAAKWSITRVGVARGRIATSRSSRGCTSTIRTPRTRRRSRIDRGFRRRCTGAYDGEVASTDAQIGRLLERLEPTAASTARIVVVVGDHGESLGEHGEQQHGFFVYDAAMHIPLIVAGPGVPAARGRPIRSASST